MLLVSKSKLKNITNIVLSLLYGYLFTLIPHMYFKDRANYIFYATYYDELLSLKSDLFLFTSEPVFLYINKLLSFLFIPENTVYSLIFFINFVLCYIFLSYARSYLFAFIGLLAFFLLPFGFSYQLGSLRQSLAASLFLAIIYYSKSTGGVLIFISVLLGLIHTSFFITTPFLVLDYIFLRVFSEARVGLRIAMHFFVALIMSLLLTFISAYFSVDKLEGYLQTDSSLGYFFISFIPVLIYNIYKYYKTKQADIINIISIIGLIVYITFYLFSPIAGRVITIFIPFIFLSLTDKNNTMNFYVLTYMLIIGAYLFFNGGYLSIMVI